MQSLEMNRERPETLTSVNSENQDTFREEILRGNLVLIMPVDVRCLGRSEG